MNELSFQVKGSAVSVIVLELYRATPELFAKQLDEKTSRAPQLFLNSSIVIDLENLAADVVPDFARLLEICRAFNMQPMAFRAVPDALLALVRETGLAVLPVSSRTDSEPRNRPAAQAVAEVIEEVSAETVVEAAAAESATAESAVATTDAAAEASAPLPERPARRPSLVINRPVRSGQQVYAEDADLIILSQVSEGAEVLADGDIHVYGALRGRALAGVKGNAQARIFCQNLSAELVSIAGNFILNETLRKQQWQQPAHIYLDGDDVHVVAL